MSSHVDSPPIVVTQYTTIYVEQVVKVMHAAGQSLPVILFLHGSGERGTDGIRQTQVGIGPALAKVGHPSAVVVYPQIPNTASWSDRVGLAVRSNGSIKKDRRDIPHRPQ